ncbi:MAG: aldehyde ferredoxin oxidoreductase family protein [Chloroflexi bacterium]|nr:aldehyde ferredoxin oxidoreductase family protein [Chloroflexota bacterium]MBU1746515.1 aldehyde ferredoxin oxidoreductase family protein [Chloroflexota bacterium]MBU1877607.1 aldehyde ferredoxin oxidoreductase family protein [Chloroflexota bacterium]
MFECYGRKLLRINLSTRTATEEPLPDALLRRWVGGMGLSVKLFTDEVPPDADPLGPDNKLYLCVGPLTGTLAPLFAQTGIVTKSPLTGGIINTYAGGHLGGAIKATGYDVIVLEGQAGALVYILITPDGVQITDCPELAGVPAREAEAAVQAAAGRDDLHTLVIGLAGENRVRYASVISETRAFGRGGAGAVLGSKNVKAMGVAGIGDVRVADPAAFQQAVNAAYETFRQDLAQPWGLLAGFGRTGTGSGMGLINERHTLATRYHRLTRFENAEAIGGEAFAEQFPTRPIACLGCQVHCGMLHKPVKTRWGEVWTRGPEYETMYSLGSLCFNDNPEMLLKANDQAEEYGMDTLSLGVNVAFAMELAERGILPRDILGDDVSLEFGNADATIRLIDLIAHRQGLGDTLAEGVRLAAQIISHGADAFALHVKGMEFAAWMPERMRGIAVTFATSNRGACHKRAPIGMELMGVIPMDSIEGRAALVAEIQNKVNAVFCLVACRFAEFALPMGQFVDLLNTATGLDYTEERFLRLGEAIWNLERLYNLAAGIDGSEDRLPDICFQVPADFPADNKPLTREDFATLLRDYYATRGWDEQGRPTPERLAALGLSG